MSLSEQQILQAMHIPQWQLRNAQESFETVATESMAAVTNVTTESDRLPQSEANLAQAISHSSADEPVRRSRAAEVMAAINAPENTKKRSNTEWRADEGGGKEQSFTDQSDNQHVRPADKQSVEQPELSKSKVDQTQPASVNQASSTNQLTSVNLAAGDFSGLNRSQLAVAAAQCSRCTLSKTKLPRVFDSGNAEAGIMLIANTPSSMEGAAAEPFVGAAGALLDNMLAAIQLNRQQVYMTHLVKCQPTSQVSLKASHVDACASFFKQQLAMVKPRVILVLGEEAALNLLGREEAFAQLRGKAHEYQNTKVVASHSPDYLLSNPAAKREAWSDLQLASQLLNR